MLKAWVSSKLSKGQLYGWFLDTENNIHRKAIIKINKSCFDVDCNKIRHDPVKYPLHHDFGFRLDLKEEFINGLPPKTSVVLIDKESGKSIYKTKLDINNHQNESNIIGGLNSKFNDLTISGWLSCKNSEVHDYRIAVLKINKKHYECVANRYSRELDNQHAFKFVLPLKDVANLSKNFNVELYDKETGELIDKKVYRNIVSLAPNNFNEYLNYSMINPVVYAPYTENYKRCFAVMENIAKSLENFASHEKCTVIMPVYNRGDCVLQAVNSVLAQTYSNFELVVIDDGSTDNTQELLKTVSDQRVKLLKNSTNKGVSFSRNLGLQNAKGTYIFYLDSDNTWDDRYLKVMMGAFCKIPSADALYCGQYLYKTGCYSNFAVRFASFNRALLENRNYIDLNCFAHRRDVCEKVGYFNESLKRLVDYDFILRINGKCSIYSVPVLLSNYYMGKTCNSITQNENLPLIDVSAILNTESKYVKLKHNVTAIIPHYGNTEGLKKCIHSLLDNEVKDIVVVDNNSGSDVVDELRTLEKSLHIKLIINSKNYGFSYAVNQGIDISPKENDVLVVNNDSIFDSNAVAILSDYAYSLSDVGLVVPRQVLESKNKMIQSHVPFADISKPCDINLSLVYKNIQNVPTFSNGRVIELLYAPFFCVYIKRNVLNDAGLLDAEHGRHYRSDRVYCDFIRNVLGLKIYYISDSVVYHAHGVATSFLKACDQELYQLMCNKNQWSSTDRAELGFRAEVWDQDLSLRIQIKNQILNSSYFDYKYYISKYGDEISNFDGDLLDHYLDKGWKKGFNPSDNFDTLWYLEKYSDIKKLGICPLVHYLSKGLNEGRYPAPFQKGINTEVSGDLSFEKDIELLKNSDLFDAEWYIKQYSNDVDLKDRSAENHYLSKGWKKGYNPSEKFNTRWYLEKNLDVAKSGACPLLHYIKTGSQEGRKALPLQDRVKNSSLTKDIDLLSKSELFNSKWYAEQYSEDSDLKKVSPAEHYLTYGWKKGYNPSSKFDTLWYLTKYQDIKHSGKCPLIHYLKSGSKEGRLPIPPVVDKASSKTVNVSKKELDLLLHSEFFDPKWYANKYLKSSGATDESLVENYLIEGWKKGYNPSTKFDTQWYLTKYPDINKSGMCPLVHYLKSGIKEGRLPLPVSEKNVVAATSVNNALSKDIELIGNSDLFDAEWYIEKYLKSENVSTVSAVKHYLTEGWKKGFNPSEKFDNNLYLELYNDVKKIGICPLVHYLKSGFKESRKIIPVFKELEPTIVDKLHVKAKNRNPLISIVVASYNYAEPIKQTLDSILVQTYKNYEVIIVDDGSSDNSVEVIKQYLKYPNFFLYTHNGGVNKGLPATVKLGVDKSRGEYIAFCEADDYWHKDYLLEKVQCINKYSNTNVIVNDVQLFGEPDKVSRVNSTVVSYKTVFTSTKTFISPEDFRKQNWILTFSCVMLKKKVLQNCDFLNVTRRANLDWWLWRQVCITNYIFFVNKKLTYWRMHDSYMENDNVMGRLQQEKFLAACDRLLLQKHFSKAKSLCKYTDVDLYVENGRIFKNNSLSKYQPSFTVVMPTYNRAYCIKKAIDSMINQSYKNFELIIVDDGSTDQTDNLICDSYKHEIDKGTIKYIKKSNEGCCKARNVALAHAKNDWIVYVDSDNICSDIFLESFAFAIINNPKQMCFYGRLAFWESNKRSGEEFNLSKLLKENYIDLGVYCHSRKIYEELGGFDERMTRLVDWELITRYSKVYQPKYIDKVIMLYNDKQDASRITVNYNLYDNYCYYRKKHCDDYPLITTIIITYNHQEYIAEAIESAIVQVGEFRHEILISDDCSTDKTREVIKSYANKYPNLIKDISSEKNLGISNNLKKCFDAAQGEYIAILEGDDYWTEKYKLQRQMRFLKENEDCAMVFSRIKVLNKGKYSFLDRHKNLPTKLSGDEVIKEPTLNFIANFSCCMFRSHIMKNLPDVLFSHRFNEIALSFYIVNLGFIGYMEQPMSVYRLHDTGVWSSITMLEKLKSGLACREMALAVCAPQYRERLNDIVKKQFKAKIAVLEKEKN